MEIKRHFTLSRDPEMESHHQMQLVSYPRYPTFLEEGLNLSTGDIAYSKTKVNDNLSSVGKICAESYETIHSGFA